VHFNSRNIPLNSPNNISIFQNKGSFQTERFCGFGTVPAVLRHSFDYLLATCQGSKLNNEQILLMAMV